MEQKKSVKRTIFINGFVKDTKTEEPIVGANVYLKSQRSNSVFTDESGHFKLELEVEGENDTLIITSAGYLPYKNPVKLDKELKFTINLSKRKTDRAKQDHELVAAALDGDQRAYGKLMARYRDSIYFMIKKMVNNPDDAEDFTIEAFGKAFSNLHKYSADFAFSTWLYRIAINNCIDHIRKKRLEIYYSIDEPMEGEEGTSNASRDIPTDSLDPEEDFIKKQRILLMREVIERLNVKYRRLIELRYLKELSYEEIAQSMGLPLGTVKAQLHRAKILLQNILKNNKDKY